MIIAEISFNRDDDKDEFGEGNRIIRVCLSEDKREVYFSLELGRREDDTINLSFNLEWLFILLIRKLIHKKEG